MLTRSSTTSLAVISTSNPSAGPFLHLKVQEGHCELATSMNIYATNLRFLT